MRRIIKLIVLLLENISNFTVDIQFFTVSDVEHVGVEKKNCFLFQTLWLSIISVKVLFRQNKTGIEGKTLFEFLLIEKKMFEVTALKVDSIVLIGFQKDQNEPETYFSTRNDQRAEYKLFHR